MGFWQYFVYTHPITNFFVQNPYDDIRGIRRRSIIVTVLMITFTWAVLSDSVFFEDDDSNTRDDLEKAFGHNEWTSHFVASLGFSVGLYAFERLLGFFYSLPDKKMFQGALCARIRGKIYWQALTWFAFNAVLFGVLAWGKNAVFLNWIFSYGLYALLIVPIIIFFKYYCCGGSELMENYELKEQLEDRDRELERRNKDRTLDYA